MVKLLFHHQLLKIIRGHIWAEIVACVLVWSVDVVMATGQLQYEIFARPLTSLNCIINGIYETTALYRGVLDVHSCQ